MKSKHNFPVLFILLIISLFSGGCNLDVDVPPAPVDQIFDPTEPVIYGDLPPVVEDRTAWNCYDYDSGCCPAAGESRNITFAAYVSDDFGVQEVWVSYRFIIPEWVRAPLGFSPIYSPWNVTPRMSPLTITTTGTGFYEYTFDAAQVMVTYPDFITTGSLRLMGVDVEYEILATDTSGQTGKTSQPITLMYCALSSSPPCSAPATQTRTPGMPLPMPTKTSTQAPPSQQNPTQTVCGNYTDITSCTADSHCYWDTGFQTCNNK